MHHFGERGGKVIWEHRLDSVIVTTATQATSSSFELIYCRSANTFLDTGGDLLHKE